MMNNECGIEDCAVTRRSSKLIDQSTVQLLPMKRLRRWLHSALLALSILLCIATAGVWIRSYWVQPPPFVYSDRWTYNSGYAAIYEGEFTFVYYDRTLERTRWFQIPHFQTSVIDMRQWLGGSGWNEGWYYTSVDVRLGAMCVVWALVPIATFSRSIIRRIRRYPDGCCPRCGYDLRASPDRCPECGTIPPKKEIVSS
jgi:hypothetical protein